MHDGKMKQAEVDKELLRLADHIRSQQAQQRARAIPINLAQAVRNPIGACPVIMVAIMMTTTMMMTRVLACRGSE